MSLVVLTELSVMCQFVLVRFLMIRLFFYQISVYGQYSGTVCWNNRQLCVGIIGNGVL